MLTPERGNQIRYFGLQIYCLLSEFRDDELGLLMLGKSEVKYTPPCTTPLKEHGEKHLGENAHV